MESDGSWVVTEITTAIALYQSEGEETNISKTGRENQSTFSLVSYSMAAACGNGRGAVHMDTFITVLHAGVLYSTVRGRLQCWKS
jgi:hypothetical protein